MRQLSGGGEEVHTQNTHVNSTHFKPMTLTIDE